MKFYINLRSRTLRMCITWRIAVHSLYALNRKSDSDSSLNSNYKAIIFGSFLALIKWLLSKRKTKINDNMGTALQSSSQLNALIYFCCHFGKKSFWFCILQIFSFYSFILITLWKKLFQESTLVLDFQSFILSDFCI